MKGNSTIADKVKALLSKAESLKEIGNLAEAEAFMLKAEELIMAHNLSRHEIHMAGGKERDRFDGWCYSERISYKENLAGNRWKLDLIKMLAKHNLCNTIIDKTGDRGNWIIVYGLGENVEMVIWLYNFLSVKLLHLAKKSRELNPVSAAYCRHTYLKSFLIGAVNGINEKIIEQQRAAAMCDQINALIVINKEDLNKYRDTQWPSNHTTQSKSIRLTAGYREGFAAGKDMNLGQRISAAQAKVESKLLK
jgi:Protein of unknown function (DUF2786)